MRTREVIAKCNKWTDTFGNDLVEVGHLKTKADCFKALENHKVWLELTVSDELRGIDRFIQKLMS